ncbi:MAG: hypothetical protein ACP5N7_04910 [Candidatus Pacearchaeota archaeon]
MDKWFESTIKYLKNSLPIIIILLGALAFIYSVFGSFEDERYKEVWSGFGKTVLAGGFFSLLLKTVQYMGVIKEELSEVIFCDPKYLKKRNDLDIIWGTVSRIIFKDKFPKISGKIIEDVRKLYFPTDHVLYYDDYQQTLEIELIDPKNQTIEVIQRSLYTVFPKDKSKFELKTNNRLFFNVSEQEVSFNISTFKVNGQTEAPIINSYAKDSYLNTNFVITLEGKDSYKIESVIYKKYSMLYDNVIGTTKDYIINNFNIKVITKGAIDINFYQVGTLSSFKKTDVLNKTYKEFDYKGLIYPKQGYLMFLKKI